jgi:hypothetical protein
MGGGVLNATFAHTLSNAHPRTKSNTHHSASFFTALLIKYHNVMEGIGWDKVDLSDIAVSAAGTLLGLHCALKSVVKELWRSWMTEMAAVVAPLCPSSLFVRVSPSRAEPQGNGLSPALCPWSRPRSLQVMSHLMRQYARFSPLQSEGEKMCLKACRNAVRKLVDDFTTKKWTNGHSVSYLSAIAPLCTVFFAW